MTCLEYLMRLTDNGTKIKMPSKQVSQVTNRTGSNNANFTNVVFYQAESLSEAKANEKMLEKVTMMAFNSKTPYQFYAHVIKIVPKDFRNGDYDSDPWTELLSDLVLEISMDMSSKAYTERMTKGAQAMLAMLTARVEAWQKRMEVKAEKASASNSSSGDGEDGEENGVSNGGFQLIIKGSI